MGNGRISRAASAALAVVVMSSAMPAWSADEEDPWGPLRPLAGAWKGTGSGFGSVTDVTHDWEFVISDQFLRLRTRSAPKGDDGSSDVHEDVGMLSRDADNGTFIFRQFLSEGFVNTFEVSVQDGDFPAYHFGYRDAESAGGMRAQMRLTFVAEDEYEMVLDLAAPGKEFAACQQMHMKRAR